jgi:hypothetical protein
VEELLCIASAGKAEKSEDLHREKLTSGHFVFSVK